MKKSPKEKEPEIELAANRIAKNVPGAATVTGLPIIVVQRAKDRGCPAFKDNGNINCDELLDFVAENGDLAEGLDNQIDPRVQKAWDAFESRMGKRQKRLMLSRHLIDKEVIKRSWFRNVIACRTKLYQLENSMSVEAGMKLGLTNEQVNQVKEILMKHQRLAIREMFQGEFGKVECPLCKQEVKQ